MLDAAVWSKSASNGSDIHVKFVDWLPLVFSSLGMLIINSVEKQRLSADSFSYSGSGVAWKARVVLFLGFAALAGGMAGGVAVFVLKYIVPSVGFPALGMGIETLASNALVGFRYVLFFQVAMLLWRTKTDPLVAPLCSGLPKIWKMNTRTTCRFRFQQRQAFSSLLQILAVVIRLLKAKMSLFSRSCVRVQLAVCGWEGPARIVLA